MSRKAPAKPRSVTPAALTPAQFARFYSVDVRTVQRWLSARSPNAPSRAQLSAPRLMLRWYAALPGAAQSRLAHQFRARLTKLRIDLERKPEIVFDLTTPTGLAATSRTTSHPAEPSSGALRAPGLPSDSAPAVASPPSDPDPGAMHGAPFLTPEESAEFDRTYDSTTARQDALADLRKKRAYWLLVLDRATARADEHAINFASDKFTTYARELHKAELLAQRQGLELGDVLPRAAHERIIRAHIHHALRCLDRALPALCRRALNLSFPEEVRAILEPALLSAAFFEPIAQAAALATGQALPAWVPACYAETIDAYLESGRELHTARVSEILLHETQTAGAGI